MLEVLTIRQANRTLIWQTAPVAVAVAFAVRFRCLSMNFICVLFTDSHLKMRRYRRRSWPICMGHSRS